MELIANKANLRRQWTPAYLEVAATEAREFLTEQQYEHAVQQIYALCEETDPSHPLCVDVDAIEDFYELRDKGGVLGKINLRIYFWIFRDQKAIVVLGVWKKECDNKTPARIIKRMKARKRLAECQIGSFFSAYSKDKSTVRINRRK